MSENPFDPSRFDLSRASEELRGVVDFLEKTMPRSGARPVTAAAAQAVRAEFENGPFQFAKPSERAEQRQIAGPARPIPLRIFRPPGTARGAMLHIHGGGWVVGRASMNDAAN